MLATVLRGRAAFAGVCAILLVGFATLLGTGSAFALTPEQGQALRDISRKFSTISTLSGRFVQHAPDGKKTEGRFYIARPGRVRFDYDAPSTLSVISDGSNVLVQDTKLGTADIWPLSQTPLKFLLDKNLDLATSTRVIGVSQQADTIRVTIKDESRFGGGLLSLTFEKGSYDLRHWTVTDQQGLDTSVNLSAVQTNVPITGKTFNINYAAVTNQTRENNPLRQY